jgi:hypothetical protein
MTSLLEPDPARLGMFNGFTEWGRVTERVEVPTQRLDDIAEIDRWTCSRSTYRGGTDGLSRRPRATARCGCRAHRDLLRPALG